ncbi:hypothetical protein KC354_g7052 [Hortaea werneckii]|nr:hypothetical protein KC354_g7052 [Hortaea werneckii]
MAKQLWRSSIRTPLQSRVFHASTPQITLPPGWFASRLASPIRRFPDIGFNVINSTTKVEEERWSWCSSEAFYPADIGELLHSRYQIMGKLGYGGHSTAWLCRDLKAHKYVVAKICETVDFSAERELLAYTRISSLKSSHTGYSLLRKMLDTFEIGNRGQKHTCLIHEPLDLKAASVLFSIFDESILKDHENNQMTHPSARKTTDETVIYESRGLGWDKEIPERPSRPTLIDLGEARCGSDVHQGLVQPAAYRAPEVTFNMPWNSSADIWNLGVLTWHLRHNELLFTTTPREGEDMAYHEIPRMVGELGMPPAEFIQRSNFPRLYFDDYRKGTDGCPTTRPTPSPKRLIPSETTPEDFVAFMKKMLTCLPEERQSAEQLFGDAWLNS